MHRALVALLLAPAILAASSAGRVLHTHAYQGHDHPEHHHGLAAHEHHAVPAHPDEGTPHLEPCDPGEHAIPFAFLCAGVPAPHVESADVEPRLLPAPEGQQPPLVGYADVRVHGPPTRAHASPRAPPLTSRA